MQTWEWAQRAFVFQHHMSFRAISLWAISDIFRPSLSNSFSCTAILIQVEMRSQFFAVSVSHHLQTSIKTMIDGAFQRPTISEMNMIIVMGRNDVHCPTVFQLYYMLTMQFRKQCIDASRWKTINHTLVPVGSYHPK